MSISFFDIGCVRVPGLPVSEFDIKKISIKLIDHDKLKEAILVAAPDFVKIAEKIAANPFPQSQEVFKVTHTLSNYLNRICYRPTPFGLFSSISSMKWGDSTKIQFPKNATRWKANLDKGVLCQIIDNLEKRFLKELRYTLNSSFYRAGNEFRYVEDAVSINKKKKYKVSAVDISAELEFIIEITSKGPVSFKDIICKLAEHRKTDLLETATYLEELISSKILTSELQVRLSDSHPISQVVEILNKLHRTKERDLIIRGLEALIESMKNVGTSITFKDLIDETNAVIELIGIPFEISKPIQIDYYRDVNANFLDNRIRYYLEEAVNALHILADNNTTDPWLTRVKSQIKEKFGDQAICLACLFDPELGIEDPDHYRHLDFGDPVLNQLNIFFANKDESLEPESRRKSIIFKFLNKKFQAASLEGSSIICISSDEVKSLRKSAQPKPLPNTFGVMFKLINDLHLKICIEVAGGASGSTLFGRFGDGDKELGSLLNEIATFEADCNPDYLIASVTHLPENRLGNILQNPDIRRYQIPYLSNSALPVENQINVNDLYIYLEGERLYLYDRKREKHVLPRIDNAHNFSNNTLPIYRLLGAIQAEEVTTSLQIAFSIEHLGILIFPRIQFKQIVLQQAQWHLTKEDISELFHHIDSEDLFRIFADKFTKWRIPQKFLLVEGDQTLLYEKTPASFRHFLYEIRDKQRIVLREYFEPAEDTVSDNEGRNYNHQFVVVGKCPGPNTSVRLKHPDLGVSNVDRFFSPGSEWYYYKIYCSTYSVDDILVGIIMKLSDKWLNKGLINEWFFVRYKDPKDHIRLRFRLDAKFIGIIQIELKEALNGLILLRIVDKVQTDTYERELERYPPAVYHLIESFFCNDSLFCVHLLREMKTIDNIQKLAFSIKVADQIFDSFNMSTIDRHDFCLKSYKSFSQEFALTYKETSILSNFYHSHLADWKQLFTTFNDTPYYANFSSLWDKGTITRGKIATAISDLMNTEEERLRVLSGLIHMHFNRLYTVGQRKQEMTGFYVLFRHYQSLMKNKKI